MPVASVRRRVRMPSRVAPIAAAPAAALAVALVACTPHGEVEEPEAIVVIETIETIELPLEEHVLMGDIMPVDRGDESGGEEQPSDPEATDPEEVELMGDVAWGPEPEPEAKPEPHDVIMGRIPPKR